MYTNSAELPGHCRDFQFYVYLLVMFADNSPAPPGYGRQPSRVRAQASQASITYANTYSPRVLHSQQHSLQRHKPWTVQWGTWPGPRTSSSSGGRSGPAASPRACSSCRSMRLRYRMSFRLCARAARSAALRPAQPRPALHAGARGKLACAYGTGPPQAARVSSHGRHPPRPHPAAQRVAGQRPSLFRARLWRAAPQEGPERAARARLPTISDLLEPCIAVFRSFSCRFSSCVCLVWRVRSNGISSVACTVTLSPTCTPRRCALARAPRQDAPGAAGGPAECAGRGAPASRQKAAGGPGGGLVPSSPCCCCGR